MTSDEINDKISMLLQDMRQAKPDERSETARRYAIAITMLEKVYAYFRIYVLEYIE
jgi:hypothetical protein